MTYDITAHLDAFYPGFSGDQSGDLNQSVTLVQLFEFFPQSRVTVAASAVEADTAPQLQLSAGDDIEWTAPLTSTERREYSFIAEGTSGETLLSLTSQPDDNDASGVNIGYVKVAKALHLGLAPDVQALEPFAEDAWLLTPFEVASSLAYEYSGGPPDLTLLRKAITGELNNADVIAAEIERLGALDGQSNTQGL